MKPGIRIRILFLCLVVLLAGYSAAPAESMGDDAWHFQITPYAWLTGQNGRAATLPGLPPADISVDFYEDILGNINMAGMLVGEARKGRFGLVSDIVYSDIEMKDPTPYGVLYSAVNTRSKSWIVSLAGLYRLFEDQSRFLDGLVGFRYWSVDTDMTLFAGLLPERNISNSEDWFDPFIGLKGLSALGKSKFFVSGGVLLGGFGVSSDLFWDASINLGYQWTEGFSTTLGYRYLDVDYEKNDFLYDVAQDGMTLGFFWRF